MIIISPIGQIDPSTGQTGPPASLSSQKVFYGYQWGAAGIADVLLELSEWDVISLQYQDLALDSAKRAIDGIWKKRIRVDAIPVAAWEKFEGSEIYPSKKYGAAGIIDTLINAYKKVGDSDYLNKAEESLNELYAETTNGTSLPYWPYSYIVTRGSNGIPITDWNFGSLGIIDSTLRVYNATSNMKYLEWAINATNWLKGISYNETIGSEEGLILPWYAWSERLNNTFTSFGRGNSAAISIFSELALLTHDEFYKEWSDFIVKWLINVQLEEGYWTENPVKTDGELTNFEIGVSGVIYGLLHGSYDIIGLNKSIQAGLDWLLDQFISNRTHNIFPVSSVDKSARYTFYDGMTGIARSLRFSGQGDEELKLTYQWILDHSFVKYRDGLTNLIGIYLSTSENELSDLSYTHGITGVIDELRMASTEGLIDPPIEIFEMFIDTIRFYQNDDGLWPKEIMLNISSLNNITNNQLLYIIVGIIIVVVYFIVKRLRRNIQ